MKSQELSRLWNQPKTGVKTNQEVFSPTPSERQRFLERTMDELHDALVKGNHQLAMVLVKDVRRSRKG
jgi:hypothetical protein